jgi:hypothetical protein
MATQSAQVQAAFQHMGTDVSNAFGSTGIANAIANNPDAFGSLGIFGTTAEAAMSAADFGSQGITADGALPNGSTLWTVAGPSAIAFVPGNGVGPIGSDAYNQSFASNGFMGNT